MRKIRENRSEIADPTLSERVTYLSGVLRQKTGFLQYLDDLTKLLFKGSHSNLLWLDTKETIYFFGLASKDITCHVCLCKHACLLALLLACFLIFLIFTQICEKYSDSVIYDD